MDFEVSEKMETILTMVREFVDHELVPIEGEMLHGSPESVEALVTAAQARSARWGCGRRTIPSSTAGWV